MFVMLLLTENLEISSGGEEGSGSDEDETPAQKRMRELREKIENPKSRMVRTLVLFLFSPEP